MYAKTVFDTTKVSPDQNSVLMRPETSVYSSLAFRTLKNFKNCNTNFDSLKTLHTEGGVPQYFFENLPIEPGTNFLKRDFRARLLETFGFLTMVCPVLLYMPLVVYFKKTEAVEWMYVSGGIWILCLIAGFILAFCGKKIREKSKPCSKALGNLQSTIHYVGVDASSLHSKSTDCEVRLWVDETLTLLAQKILIPQIQELPADTEQANMSRVACTFAQFGLGEDWGVYFKKAKERIDPYAHFNWQI